jgi:hypothetical protein
VKMDNIITINMNIVIQESAKLCEYINKGILSNIICINVGAILKDEGAMSV